MVPGHPFETYQWSRSNPRDELLNLLFFFNESCCSDFLLSSRDVLNCLALHDDRSQCEHAREGPRSECWTGPAPLRIMPTFSESCLRSHLKCGGVFRWTSGAVYVLKHQFYRPLLAGVQIHVTGLGRIRAQ